MSSSEDIRTRVVHAGMHIDPLSGAVTPPIYQTSTFKQKEPGVHQGWDYSRAGNPTRDYYEEALASAEGAKHAISFSSGLAAEQAIIHTLKPGDHVLVCDDVYGGTGRLFRTLYAKYGIEFEFIDMGQSQTIANHMRDNTAMIWLETPTNPTLKIIDIRAASKIAKSNKAILVVDNTFASPVFQNPLSMGADIVIHSTTKYMGGHSDLVGGAVMTNDKKHFEDIKYIQFAAGAVPSPFESYLLHRSIKTLAVRMEQHNRNAEQIANFLNENSSVERVFYPGLKTHPNHEIAKSQMSGFGGMVSFELKGDYSATVKFLQSLNIFILAESLGGVESLVNHPEKMTHASVPPELRKKLGINFNLIRLSVGIESADDLIADLDQALKT